MKGTAMTEPDAIVFVVDDNSSVREALTSLIRSVGLRVETFGSARGFLASNRPDSPACLVLDVRMPGLSGLDLQRELAEADIHIPIVFITGHGDIPMSVRAMKAGPSNSSPSPSATRTCWMRSLKPSSATARSVIGGRRR
jgi:FixJ family two-component response regulator